MKVAFELPSIFHFHLINPLYAVLLEGIFSVCFSVHGDSTPGRLNGPFPGTVWRVPPDFVHGPLPGLIPSPVHWRGVGTPMIFRGSGPPDRTLC